MNIAPRAPLPALALLLASALGRAALAQQPPADPDRVLITGAPGDPVVHTLEDELRALGLSVLVEDVPADAAGGLAALRSLVRARGAAALIAIAHGEDGIGIWVVDRTTGKITLRTVDLPADAPGDQARLAALRAVELLRLSLLELRAHPTPPEAELRPGPRLRAMAAPAPPAPRPAPAPEAGRYALGIGLAGAWSAGGLDPQAAVLLSGSVHPWSALALSVRATLPVNAARTGNDTAGYAEVRVWALEIELRWRTRPWHGWRLAGGLAVGAALVQQQGVARPGYAGRTDVVPSLLLTPGLGVQWQPWRHVGMALDVGLGLAVPDEVGVVVGSERTARWGLPVGRVGLSVLFLP